MGTPILVSRHRYIESVFWSIHLRSRCNMVIYSTVLLKGQQQQEHVGRRVRTLGQHQVGVNLQSQAQHQL